MSEFLTVYRTWGKSGIDYGWNACTREEADLLIEAGCRLEPDPSKDMKGRKWIAGDGRKSNRGGA